MQEPNTNKYPNDFDDVLDLSEIFYILFQGKWIILSITSLVSIVGVIYSLSLPNLYESKALLVPVNSSSGISGALRGYGGIASLAGVKLPSNVDQNNSSKAIKKLNTLSFFDVNLLKNIHLPDLMAVKYWDNKTNKLVYDDDVYNISTDAWVREYSYPSKQIPTAQESFKVFKTKHFGINEDINTGFITLSIKHQSPFIAKKWVELIVNEINAFYRKKDKLEAEKSVIYLNQQISTTSFSEIKKVIAELLQEETKKLALIEANKYYVFDYIDPPAVMEEKSEPRRALICIIIALFGGAISTAIVFIKYYFSKDKAN